MSISSLNAGTTLRAASLPSTTTMMSFPADNVHNSSESTAIDPRIFSHIQHIDVSNFITERSKLACANGSDSDVFRGRLCRDGREKKEVSIKRLRSPVNGKATYKVNSPLFAFLKRSADREPVISNSKRRSTFGQS